MKINFKENKNLKDKTEKILISFFKKQSNKKARTNPG